MKNLVLICLLFGGLLFFSESNMGKATIFGGTDIALEIIEIEIPPLCTHTKRETEDCPNSTDELECNRTYKILVNDLVSNRDWRYEGDAKEQCRFGNEACDFLKHPNTTTDCLENIPVPDPGPGGPVVVGAAFN